MNEWVFWVYKRLIPWDLDAELNDTLLKTDPNATTPTPPTKTASIDKFVDLSQLMFELGTNSVSTKSLYLAIR